jgi:hypothetical protein
VGSTYDLSFSTTAGLGIAVVILFLVPAPQIYKTAFVPPRLALDSAMACRVFRGLKLGLINDIDELTVESRSKALTTRSSTAGGSSNIHELNSRDVKSPAVRVELQVVSKTESSFQEQGNEIKVDGSVDPSWV